MSRLKKDKQSDKYHHGDLRNALIATGVEMLTEGGTASLSLRKLAKRVGVSHNAPYQHFADKNTLIAAIAQEGFRLLEAEMQRVIDTTAEEDAHTRIIIAGQAYVRFAVTHASHISVMFGSFPQQEYPQLSQAALDAFNKLVEIITMGQRTGEIGGDNIEEVANVLWTAVHGLSAVLIAQKIPPMVMQGRSIEQIAADHVAILCQGLLG
jgi:AcrR family transcriptional regulator